MQHRTQKWDVIERWSALQESARVRLLACHAGMVKHGSQLRPLPSTLNLEQIANPMGNCCRARTRSSPPARRVSSRLGSRSHWPEQGVEDAGGFALNGIMGMWDRGLANLSGSLGLPCRLRSWLTLYGPMWLGATCEVAIKRTCMCPFPFPRH